MAERPEPEPPADAPPPAAGRGARVAIVVQRYGAEVNGGAELHARQVAERLARRHRVDVLTTCALDYRGWDMHFPTGAQHAGGVTVHRFAHAPRGPEGALRLPKAHRLRYRLRRLLALNPHGAAARPRGDDAWDGLAFLRHQGPHSPGLLRYLATHRRDHDCAIFFTAQYEPTAVGLPAWGGPSILVPTLHEEKLMMLPQFRTLFGSAHRIFFNTAAEQRLAARLYGVPPDRGEVVGIGIEVPPPAAADVAAARARHRLPPRYLVYVGRIDTAKGCGELLAAFADAAARDPGLGLVLVGRAFMALPQDEPRIVATGFVTDAERNAIVAGALGLVLPSRHESLSMVLLEAMALGVPVLANAACAVLADHLDRSGGGLSYRAPRELAPALLRLAALPADERRRLGDAGRRYVAGHYAWPQVMARYEAAIADLAQPPAAAVGRGIGSAAPLRPGRVAGGS